MSYTNGHGGKRGSKAVIAVPFICIIGIVAAFVVILAASGELTRDLVFKEESSLSSSNTAVGGNISLSFDTSEPAYTRPKITVTVDDTAAAVPDALKALIEDYYTDKYTALGSLDYSPLDEHFYSEDENARFFNYLCDTALEYEIYLRRTALANLSFANAEITVKIKDYEIVQSGYEVQFAVNEMLSFAASDRPSYTVGTDVSASTTSAGGGGCKFRRLYEETASVVQTETYILDELGMDTNGSLEDFSVTEGLDIPALFEKMLSRLITAADNAAAERTKMFADTDTPQLTVTAENEYDRDAAVEYSYLWTDEEQIVRNTEQYSDYSEYGGNCQNFVSQCLHAGGIPMDSEGNYDDQWKWYGNDTNYKPTKQGRVPSWSDTYSFYEYCRTNTDVLAAQTDANLYTAEKGDVIQYTVDGYAYHSVIVVDKILDSSGQVIDFLVNSNTSDKVDYPMSAYGYSDMRLIKIIGYNGKAG